ncbi:MAG TPA: hypothetical protein PKN76_09410 [bacterium]|nr:hypothetical protein [bacterium]
MLTIDKRLEKYFWDGTDNISDTYFVKRMLEYGAFPDMLKIPFSVFIKEIRNINISKLRTSEKRKRFLELLLPHLDNASHGKN